MQTQTIIKIQLCEFHSYKPQFSFSQGENKDTFPNTFHNREKNLKINPNPYESTNIYIIVRPKKKITNKYIFREISHKNLQLRAYKLINPKKQRSQIKTWQNNHRNAHRLLRKKVKNHT